MRLAGQQTFADTEAGYEKAERFADQWAGDNEGFAVVIAIDEGDGIGQDGALHVMDQQDAEGFIAEWGGHVLYNADHRPRCNFCENVITGQKITVHGRTYCSFVHLDKDHR